MGRGVIEVPFNEVVTLVKDIHNNHIWDKFIVVSLWRWNKSIWCVSTQRLDYAIIILGIIGAPEHQELCWNTRYTFLIRWPEHCKLAMSFDQMHCSLIPSNKFLMFTTIIFFRGLHTANNNARIQPLRKVKILIIPTFKLVSFMCKIL